MINLSRRKMKFPACLALVAFLALMLPVAAWAEGNPYTDNSSVSATTAPESPVVDQVFTFTASVRDEANNPVLSLTGTDFTITGGEGTTTVTGAVYNEGTGQYTVTSVHDTAETVTMVVYAVGVYIGSIPDVAVVTGFAGGDGTAGNPYQIADSDQLNIVRNYLDAHFALVADIDLDKAPYNTGEGWEPIGTGSNPFTGSFDGSYGGSGHTISGLYINRRLHSNQGLFGKINEAVIKNVKLENVTVTVTVTGHGRVGGLVGSAINSDITDSYVVDSVVSVEGNFSYVGGLVGENNGTTITGSYAMATVNGNGEDANIGGLVGYNTTGGIITNSYATGDVNGEGNSVSKVGGLVGANITGGTITNSYATGDVNGDGRSGGLVGYNYDSSTITGSVFNRETTGRENGVGGGSGDGATSLTTTEMKQQNSFSEWDFTTPVWQIDEGITYPYLAWQTDNRDLAPPVFVGGYPQVENVTDDTADLRVQADEDATAYYVVLAEGADAPGAAEIKAGTDAGGQPIAADRKGSIALTAGTDGMANITGLTTETAYDIYMAAEDDAGNLQPDVLTAKVQVTTAPDTTAPTVADGAIITSGLTDTSVTLSWNKATDNTSVQNALQYLVYRSDADNIDSVADAEANGTPVGAYTADIDIWEVNGLTSGTTYYFNVIVKDGAGNKNAYSMKEITTNNPSSGGGEDNDDNDGDNDSSGGKTIITVTISRDSATGIVTAVPDANDLNNALAKAKADVRGIVKVNIEITEITGASSYVIELPTAALTGSSATRIEIETGMGTIILPGDMLSGSGVYGGSVGLSIGTADTSGIDEEIRRLISGKPVIEIKLISEGSNIAWNNPDAPVTVSVPYTPTEQELADPEHITIWYIDGEGNVVEVPSGRYDPETGMVTFSTTHFSKYAVAYVHKTFDDFESMFWANKPIQVLASKGILKGISETEYAPQVNITRADFLYYLVRTLSVDTKLDGNFDDIEHDAYYYKEIGIAKKLDITSGTGNNKYSPEASITRQDMMVLAERALRILKKLEVQGTASDIDRFADKSLVAENAVNSVASIVKAGLIVGSGDKVNPLGNATRAEAAVFLYRIYNKY